MLCANSPQNCPVVCVNACLLRELWQLNHKFFFLDEPLGALDALTRYTLQNEILEIMQAQQSTVCMITNDVDEALLMGSGVPAPAKSGR